MCVCVCVCVCNSTDQYVVQAHLDNVSEDLRVIDGAKGKWCNILLLDSMIYILAHDTFNATTRRSFNQPVILYECILEELRLIDMSSYIEVITCKTEETDSMSRHPDTSFMYHIHILKRRFH